MKKRNPKSIKSRENIIFYIMNHKLKIVEDFLNSLESEQLKANQDTMLISGSYENQSGAIGTNASRCVNGTTACIGSINDRRCSNGVCDYTINGKNVRQLMSRHRHRHRHQPLQREAQFS